MGPDPYSDETLRYIPAAPGVTNPTCCGPCQQPGGLFQLVSHQPTTPTSMDNVLSGTDPAEMRAYCGLLLLAGMHRVNLQLVGRPDGPVCFSLHHATEAIPAHQRQEAGILRLLEMWRGSLQGASY